MHSYRSVVPTGAGMSRPLRTGVETGESGRDNGVVLGKNATQTHTAAAHNLTTAPFPSAAAQASEHCGGTTQG